MAGRDPKWWADPTPGRIFRLARAVEGGVEMRSPPRWRNATAVISPTGLIVEHAGTSAVARWTDDTWGFVPWDVAKGAVGLGAAHRAAAAALYPTWSLPVRLVLPRRRQLRATVPLEALTATADGASDTISVLEALRRLLSTRPECCDALNDRARCEQFASALRSWRPDDRFQPPLLGHQRTEAIEGAARSTGGFHRSGRPLPGWSPPPREPVVRAVQDWLNRSHATRRFEITDDEVLVVLNRTYFEARPWPFGALLPG